MTEEPDRIASLESRPIDEPVSQACLRISDRKADVADSVVHCEIRISVVAFVPQVMAKGFGYAQVVSRRRSIASESQCRDTHVFHIKAAGSEHCDPKRATTQPVDSIFHGRG